LKKARLNWRKSGGVKRSLVWIPVRKDCISFKNGQVYHNKHHFKIWDPYGLSQYKFRSGSFNEDSRGRWYFNVVVEVKCAKSIGTSAVGIDLGSRQNSPKGRTGLRIREWTCECGVTHDRLAVGIPNYNQLA
jgi:putative transposase